MVTRAAAQSQMWGEPVEVARGDLWQLGKHRLLCGDATNAGDVARLFAGEKASAVITDPPYGMLETGWDTATFAFIAPMTMIVCPEVTAVLFCSLPYGFALHQAMLACGWQWRWDAIWIKSNGGIGTSKKRPISTVEHLFAYSMRGIAATSLTFHGYEAGEAGIPWQRTNMSQQCKHTIQVRLKELRHSSGSPDGRRWIRADLYGRSKKNLPVAERTSHPTQKPLEIVEKLAILLAEEGQVIYDPFLGSGTTLLACEHTGRACYGLEICETYCGQIITRWQEATGQRAVKL